jgi:hypothetical protein
MNVVLTTLLGLVGARVISLAALAIRWRWQVTRDRQRQETLALLAAHLPTGGTIELNDVDEGVRVRMTSAHGARPTDD